MNKLQWIVEIGLKPQHESPAAMGFQELVARGEAGGDLRRLVDVRGRAITPRAHGAAGPG